MFRILLDTEVNHELYSLEERFKSRLSSLVQTAQNNALASYHSVSQTAPEILSSTPFVESQFSELKDGSATITDRNSEEIFEDIQQIADGEITGEPVRNSNWARKSKNTQHHSSFDSGYHTDSWGKDSLQQIAPNKPNDTLLPNDITTSTVTESSMNPLTGRACNALSDETWPFHSGIMEMDDPLDCQVYGIWSQQYM